MHLLFKGSDNLRWLEDVTAVARLDDPRVERRSHPNEHFAMNRIVRVGKVLKRELRAMMKESEQ